MNTKSINLLYNYVIIDENYCVTGAVTYSCEVPLDNYITVSDARDEYIGKYYNSEDGLFYYDTEYTQIFNIEDVI